MQKCKNVSVFKGTRRVSINNYLFLNKYTFKNSKSSTARATGTRAHKYYQRPKQPSKESLCAHWLWMIVTLLHVTLAFTWKTPSNSFECSWQTIRWPNNETHRAIVSPRLAMVCPRILSSGRSCCPFYSWPWFFLLPMNCLQFLHRLAHTRDVHWKYRLGTQFENNEHNETRWKQKCEYISNRP